MDPLLLRLRYFLEFERCVLSGMFGGDCYQVLKNTRDAASVPLRIR